MKIVELNVKNSKEMESGEFGSFVDVVRGWYGKAFKELYNDISNSEYCKLYLIKDDFGKIVGGVIISNIQVGQYKDVNVEFYDQIRRELLKLTKMGYFYLMWFYVKKNCRKAGFGTKLMNFVLRKYPKISLEAGSDERLVEYYKKFGFKEIVRNYNGEKSVFMRN